MTEITARADFSHAPCSKGDRLARGCVVVVGRTANLPSFQAFRLYTYIRNIQERSPAASAAADQQGADAQKCGISLPSLSADGRLPTIQASSQFSRHLKFSTRIRCRIAVIAVALPFRSTWLDLENGCSGTLVWEYDSGTARHCHLMSPRRKSSAWREPNSTPLPWRHFFAKKTHFGKWRRWSFLPHLKT